MFHPTEVALYRNAIPIEESPTRQAMAVAAMFAGACHGAMPLTRALAALRHLSNADDLTLVREVFQDGPQLIATTAAQHTVLAPQTAAWAAQLGQQAATLVPGHVLIHPKDSDLAAIVLMTAPRLVDLLVVRGGIRHLLSDFGAVAPDIWARRHSGIAFAAISDVQNFTRRAAADAAAKTDDAAAEGLLSAQNPAGLTAAEYRVAVCLKEGLKPMAIGARLELVMPEVRTHLRNIYAKTGLDGLSAVVHRLQRDAD